MDLVVAGIWRAYVGSKASWCDLFFFFGTSRPSVKSATTTRAVLNPLKYYCWQGIWYWCCYQFASFCEFSIEEQVGVWVCFGLQFCLHGSPREATLITSLPLFTYSSWPSSCMSMHANPMRITFPTKDSRTRRWFAYIAGSRSGLRFAPGERKRKETEKNLPIKRATRNANQSWPLMAGWGDMNILMGVVHHIALLLLHIGTFKTP